MTDKICSCPGRGDGSLRWPCEAHPPNQNETKSNQRFCFTEAQVEAAAEALASREPMRSATEWENLHEFERSGFRESARAALVAAQGAAPQAESEAGKRLSSEFRADLVEAARERIQAVWADVPEGVDAKTLAQNVVSAQEFFWLAHAFPVLPSSGVDEDARSLSAWPTVDEVRETFKKSADRLAFDRMIAEVERDAALAAIGRIRQAVSGHPECDRYEEGDVISCGWKSAYASVVAALDGAPEPDREYHLTEVETKREMTNPVYVLRGGVYLLDEHAGVLIDSAGNFSAKTKGNPRSLAVLLKAIAESIEDDVAWLPVEGEQP